MKELIVPRRLKRGDTVAFISISGGRAGDPDMIGRYRLAKSRFEEAYGVSVIETPHALSGSAFLYSHPELRAGDLHWALTRPEISGIVCNMGGDDSYRVLPYIDPGLIREHPKVFMGYSDIATWMAVFAYAGVRAYYGPNVLTPFGQPGRLDDYTKEAVRKALFSGDVIGEIRPSEAYTPIEWRSDVRPEQIVWTANDGYSVVQGTGTVSGRLFVLCPGPLQQIMATKYYPGTDFFEGTVLAIEHGQPYGSTLAGLHTLRSFAASGAFDKAAAVITGKMDGQARASLLKVINEEVHRNDLVILENVDFIHRTPMTVLPTGAVCRIDCEKRTLSVTEPGAI